VVGDLALSVVTRDRPLAGWWRLLRAGRVFVVERALHGVIGVAADLPGGARLAVLPGDATALALEAIACASYLPGPLRVRITPADLHRAGERWPRPEAPPAPAVPLCTHPRTVRGCAHCFQQLIRRRLTIAGVAWPEVPDAPT
jgi:hypothetical protein